MLLVLVVTVSLMPGALTAQPRDGLARLPRARTQVQMRDMERELSGTVVLLRVIEALDPRMRPSELESPAAATWIRPDPDSPPVAVVPWAAVARATRLEAWQHGTWVPVEVRWGSPAYDLAALDLVDGISDHALALAEEAPLAGELYVVVAEPSDQRTRVLALSWGRALRPPWGLYLRSGLTGLPGLPVVDGAGAMVGLHSVAAPDGRGGSLVVPVDRIRAWWAARLQLGDPRNPLGWSPAQRVEEVIPQLGLEPFP
jgi:hypothetical protein